MNRQPTELSPEGAAGGSLSARIRARWRRSSTAASPAATVSAPIAEERRAAFARIARTYEADLLRTARRLCQNNNDQAQDLVQDALIRAYEVYRRGDFIEQDRTRAWLLRILTNGFLNDYRRRKRWDAGVTVDTLTANGETGPDSTHAAPSDTPGAALMAGTLDEPLERALQSLPPPLRVCVLLVDVEDMDYAEAAAVLGVPIGTIRSRLSRARLRLQKQLYEYARDHRRT